MADISSRTNPQVKHIARLQRSKRARQEHNACIVEGARAIAAFLKSRHTIIQVYMTEQALAHTELDIAPERITRVREAVMEKMSAQQTPSGMLAHVELAPWQAEQPQPGLCLVEIADPGNLGTLIRTSVALGYSTITCISCADPWNPKCVQASAGTIAHASVHMTDWHTLRTHASMPLYALTGHHAVPLEHVTWDQAPLILVGNEAHGLPEEVITQADARIRLAIPGPAESYNAAIAGSIALYVMHQHKEAS